MAITFELKLCLSNFSTGMERKTEGNQSTNISLIFTSQVDLFLIKLTKNKDYNTAKY